MTLRIFTGRYLIGSARENMRAVFVEYAWDMGWCDPCAADPMTTSELFELGARWVTVGTDLR